MNLSERRVADDSTLELTKQFFKNLNVPVRFFYDVDASSNNLVMVFKDECFYYKDFKECFEDLKPIIKALEHKKEDLESHDRKMRWLLNDCVESLVQQFNVSSYTISLVKHEVDNGSSNKLA